MLSRLSIRDIVLIERLDIDFSSGLSVLTGETGAGKSILLDALSLALGARGDASLVRHGAAQGQVSAVFDVPKQPSRARHPHRKRAGRRRRHHPAPRADRRRPHPRLRQRSALQRHADARHRPRACRDPRTARRTRSGRRFRPSRTARRLWGPCRRGRELRRGLAALARLRAAVGPAPRARAGRRARGRLSQGIGGRTRPARSAARRGDRARRHPHRDDEGRKGRGRDQGCAGRSLGPEFAAAAACEPLAPAAAQVGGSARYPRRCRDVARRGADLARRRAVRRGGGAAGDRIRSAKTWNGPRSGFLRCAPRRANSP